MLKVDSINPESRLDNYDIYYDFEYSDDKLSVRVDGCDYACYDLKNGNIPHEALEYQHGHLKSETFKNFFGVGAVLDGCDKCIFNWIDDNVSSISFYKDSQYIGALVYKYRNEKCNSPLIYAHTYNMIYVPSAFCQECLFNHAAIFHSGLPTPTRLIESYLWPDGRKGEFKYQFDCDGNPITIIYESTRFRGDKYTITEECMWEEY